MPGCKKAFAIGASPWPYGGLRASLRLVVAGDPRRLARRPGGFISYNKESYFNQQGLDIQLPIEGFLGSLPTIQRTAVGMNYRQPAEIVQAL